MNTITCWFCDTPLGEIYKTEMVLVVKVRQFYLQAELQGSEIRKPVCDACANTGKEPQKMHFEFQQMGKFK